MNSHLEKGMESTQAHMVGEPYDHQPASPIRTAKHKNSPDDRQEPDKANPDQLICGRGICPEFPKVLRLEMVTQGKDADADENPSNYCDRARTLIQLGHTESISSDKQRFLRMELPKRVNRACRGQERGGVRTNIATHFIVFAIASAGGSNYFFVPCAHG